MSEAKPETKKQRRVVITIWEGGITEVRVFKITLRPRQLFFGVLITVAALSWGNLPQAIEWAVALLK